MSLAACYADDHPWLRPLPQSVCHDTADAAPSSRHNRHLWRRRPTRQVANVGCSLCPFREEPKLRARPSTRAWAHKFTKASACALGQCVTTWSVCSVEPKRAAPKRLMSRPLTRTDCAEAHAAIDAAAAERAAPGQRVALDGGGLLVEAKPPRSSRHQHLRRGMVDPAKCFRADSRRPSAVRPSKCRFPWHARRP